jgi:hypothetical protein
MFYSNTLIPGPSQTYLGLQFRTGVHCTRLTQGTQRQQSIQPDNLKFPDVVKYSSIKSQCSRLFALVENRELPHNIGSDARFWLREMISNDVFVELRTKGPETEGQRLELMLGQPIPLE